MCHFQKNQREVLSYRTVGRRNISKNLKRFVSSGFFKQMPSESSYKYKLFLCFQTDFLHCIYLKSLRFSLVHSAFLKCTAVKIWSSGGNTFRTFVISDEYLLENNHRIHMSLFVVIIICFKEWVMERKRWNLPISYFQKFIGTPPTNLMEF